MDRNELHKIIAVLKDARSTNDDISFVTKELIMSQERGANMYLLDRLTDYDDPPKTKEHLVFALGSLNEISAEDVLKQILFSDDDHQELKRKVILALGNLRVVDIVDHLVSIIASNSPKELVYPSIVALGDISDTKAIDVLVDSLKSNNPFIPQTAAQALGKYGEDGLSALSTLEELARNGNDIERKFALGAINNIKVDSFNAGNE